MTLSVSPRGLAERFFGFDIRWNDFGDDFPVLTLDPTQTHAVEADGTYQATMARVLDHRIPLRTTSTAWTA